MLLEVFAAGPLAANCYVIAPGPDGPCVVIDPGQQATGPLRTVLTEHALAPAAVLLTHGHFDHVASAAAVCAQHGCPAYLGGGDEYMLTDPLAALSPELRAGIVQILGPGDDLRELRPDVVIPLGADAEVLDLAGLSVGVLPVPGHTPGSVTYRIGGPVRVRPDAAEVPEVLFTGDTLFAGSIGRTDLPGGCTEQILASIREKLLVRSDSALVLPGHGPVTTIGAERAGNPFLAARP